MAVQWRTREGGAQRRTTSPSVCNGKLGGALREVAVPANPSAMATAKYVHCRLAVSRKRLQVFLPLLPLVPSEFCPDRLDCLRAILQKVRVPGAPQERGRVLAAS